MRVKISYGVELDQIPEEVQKLFDSVTDWQETLSRQSDTIEDLLSGEEFEACVSVMNKMRETMGNMDQRIAELSNILTGYNTYIKENGANDDPPERRPVVDTASSNVIQGTNESDGGDDEPAA